MAITFSNLTHGSNTVSQTSYTTASITPSANHLILVWVASRFQTGTPNVPTLSGNGLTYVQVATQLNVHFRLTLFCALGASPSSGAVTIDFAGQAQTAAHWSVEDGTGMDARSANGLGAIVQSVGSNAAADGTSHTVTLGAFSNAANGTVGGFIQAGGPTTFTAGNGFTLLAQDGAADDQLGSEWRTDNDLTVDMTSLVSQGWIGIGAEIKFPEDGGFAFYRPYTLGAAINIVTGGLYYYWRRRKQEKPDE